MNDVHKDLGRHADMIDLQKLKVDYDHPDEEDLIEALERIFKTYANRDYWREEKNGEPPHHLAKGVPLNFRPRYTTDGYRFAEEALEKIAKFRREKDRRMSMYDEIVEDKHDYLANKTEPIKTPVPLKHNQTENQGEVDFAGGKVSSSKVPPVHLIPTVALEKTAQRFALGVERKGDKSWNALSENQEVLKDLDFLIERTAHTILHVLRLRDKLKQFRDGDEEESLELFNSDDDASAIVWSGMFFQCAIEALKDECDSE